MRCVKKTTSMHSPIGYGYTLHDHGTNCVMKVHINGRQNSPYSMNNMGVLGVGMPRGFSASNVLCITLHCTYLELNTQGRSLNRYISDEFNEYCNPCSFAVTRRDAISIIPSQ